MQKESLFEMYQLCNCEYICVVLFSRYYKTLYKQSAIDQSELNAMQEDRDRFLHQAVQNYIQCLQLGDKHDIRIFRLVSLWFSNPTSTSISELIMVRIF